MNKQSDISQFTRAAWITVLLVMSIILLSAEKSQAETAANDRWYYVDDSSFKFSIPDKFQHFWGSAALAGIFGPMPTLALGITKEIYDDKIAKVGFSPRDIAADILGIVSAKLTESEKVNLRLDWNPQNEAIIVQLEIGI